MRNVIVLIIISLLATAFVFFVAKHFSDEKTKLEIGVYPNEFKTKVYDKMTEWVKNLFLYNFVDSLKPTTVKQGLKDVPVKTNFGQGEWGQTDWSMSMAKSAGLELDKEYGVGEINGPLNGHFWIAESALPKFKNEVIANHNYIMSTKGIDLNNDIYFRNLKTMLETDLGIDINNEYFLKQFKKHNS